MRVTAELGRGIPPTILSWRVPTHIIRTLRATALLEFVQLDLIESLQTNLNREFLNFFPKQASITLKLTHFGEYAKVIKLYETQNPICSGSDRLCSVNSLVQLKSINVQFFSCLPECYHEPTWLQSLRGLEQPQLTF